MVLVAVLWGKLTVRRVNVVYLTAGVALIVENLAEVYLFDSSGWRVLQIGSPASFSKSKAQDECLLPRLFGDEL